MKIRPGSVPKPSGGIPAPNRIPPDSNIRFSFKHLDLHTKEKFCLARCKDGYVDKLLGRLRDVCMLSVDDFRSNKSKAIRAHTIDWDDTTEKEGFSCLNDQLRAEQPWQFQLTANAHGRVHGFLIDSTFYVVWIDPDHSLYS